MADDLVQLDPFFESNYISKLNECNFKQFLWNNEMVMVMFYDTCNPHSFSLRKYFAAAAATTGRPNTAYAGVNCSEEPDLCYMEKACKLPLFKLYSGIESIGAIQEIRNVNSEYLKNYIESARNNMSVPRQN